MLNASQILTLIPQDGSLLLLMTKTKEGQITVVVDPKYPKSAENTALKEVLSPKTITGTPEQLDAGFMEYLTKTVASANNLKEALEKIDAETKAAIDKAKADSAKKIAEASKSKTKTASPVKSTGKTTTPSPTQAVLGENNQDEESEETAGKEEKPAATEAKKEEAKPEEKVPVSLF